DLLEFVQVDHEQRAAGAFSLRAIKLFSQAILEVDVIVQPGQTIGNRLVLHLFEKLGMRNSDGQLIGYGSNQAHLASLPVPAGAGLMDNQDTQNAVVLNKRRGNQ